MPSSSGPSTRASPSWLEGSDEPFAGKYGIERVIGQGGMGTVFEARHLRLGHRVAIKVLDSSLREYPELVQRFEREARACGSLSSEHAIRVFDIDLLEDGTPFIVMELLAGRDLAAIIERDGPQPVSRAVRWITEACDAIAEAHRLGIIHRDLKPSNLFLAEHEGKKAVKVLDFGIAKRVKSGDSAITQALIPLGTPQYMSPEQVRCAKDVDARSDVWSLGISLYELVCGTTPFPDPSASAVIAAIAADDVPDPRIARPDLEDAFVAVVMKALSKNAAQRQQSVEELIADLAPFANEDDDSETVSAVRTKLASTPDGDSGDRPTLDVIEMPEPDPFAEARRAPRMPFESRSDRTVPPVAMIEPPRRRRFKSIITLSSVLAVAAATVIVAARVLAPAGSGSAEVAPVFAAAEMVSPAVVAPTTPAIVAETQTLPADIAPPAPVARPVAANANVGGGGEAEAATKAVPTPLAQTTLPSKPLVSRPLVPALSSSDARGSAAEPKRTAAVSSAPATDKALTASRSVHGGLSSPGF